jgi:hypothetical protein
MSRHRYYGDDYDLYSTVSSTMLGALPALFGVGAAYAGLKRGYDSLSYKPPAAKRVPFADWVAPAGSTRISHRDFGRYSRRFRLARLRRYKAALKRKYIRAVKKTFF